MFRLMPEDLRLGAYVREAEATDGLAADASMRFMWEGQQYRVGDFVYLLPRCVLRAVCRALRASASVSPVCRSTCCVHRSWPAVVSLILLRLLCGAGVKGVRLRGVCAGRRRRARRARAAKGAARSAAAATTTMTRMKRKKRRGMATPRLRRQRAITQSLQRPRRRVRPRPIAARLTLLPRTRRPLRRLRRSTSRDGSPSTPRTISR
jgi:hypothetical protein